MYSRKYVGTNKLLLGIVLTILTYWLFAQAFLNIGPTVQKDLNISDGSLNIGISITSLFSGLFIVLIGSLSDKYGRVKYTYIGIFLNILGSFLLIITNNFILFLIGRIFQGLSASFIMPSTLALIKSYYTDKNRQRALSFWSIGSWGGSGLCSLFGGIVTNYFGWRYIFIISIIVSIISFILLLDVPESKIDDKKNFSFDLKGFILFFISILLLNILITKGSNFGWFSMISILLFLLSIIGILIFIRIEKDKNNPFIDFELFKNKKYSISTASNFLLNASAGTTIIINTYLQESKGISPEKSGLLSLSYLLFILIFIRIGEKYLQKFGPKKPMLLGSTLTLISICFMSLTFLPNSVYILVIIFSYALFGIGLGFYATPSTDTAISNVNINKVGIASGIYKMASSLGGAFGIAISETIYKSISNIYSYNLGASLGFLANIIFCIISIILINKFPKI